MEATGLYTFKKYIFKWINQNTKKTYTITLAVAIFLFPFQLQKYLYAKFGALYLVAIILGILTVSKYFPSNSMDPHFYSGIFPRQIAKVT